MRSISASPSIAAEYCLPNVRICSGKYAGAATQIIDSTDAGRAVDTLRGFGMPYRLAVSPDGHSVIVTDPVRGEVRVYDSVARRQRLLIAIPRDSIVATAEVPGSPSPEGVTTSPDSRWAFITLQGRNLVAMIDLRKGSIAGYAPTGSWSDGIAYSALERRP